jgi:hypothetical protein
MENIAILPWVGEKYFNDGYQNKKLLILGESHYCGDICSNCGSSTASCSITIDTIKKYLNYKNGQESFSYWMNTFTRFTNILVGKKTTVSELNEFWHSVIFYNFVQQSLVKPRIAPADSIFKDSYRAFYEILNTYEPDLIIAWGDRLWNRMPKDEGKKPSIDILDNKGGYFYYYKIKEREIPAFGIYHPSSSALTCKYTKYIQEAIRIC